MLPLTSDIFYSFYSISLKKCWLQPIKLISQFSVTNQRSRRKVKYLKTKKEFRSSLG